MRPNYTAFGVSALAIAVASVPFAAGAQTTAPADTPTAPARSPASAPKASANSFGGLEEIVVTARRQSESLMNVPIQVNAISAATLARAGTASIADVTKIAPQVILSKGISGTGATFNIRGIGSEFDDPGLDESVLINLDGVQITRGRIVAGAMFDIAQVEVLKGPQALFFGKNSTGGVVTLTSANPTDHFEAKIKGGYEFNAGERYVEAAVSGPVAEGLSVRLAGRADQMTGYIRNVAEARDNPFFPGAPLASGAYARYFGTKSLAGRLTARYQPSSKFDAVVKVSYSHDTADGSTGGIEPICSPGNVSATLGLPDPTGGCKIGLTHSQSPLPAIFTVNWPKSNGGIPYATTNVLIANAQMTYKPSDVITLSSVSSYYDVKFNGFDDITGTSFSQLYFQSSEFTHAFEQELRAVSNFDFPVNFTIGGYFEDSHRVLPQSTMITSFTVPDPRNGRYYGYANLGIVDGKAYSLSGQLRWKIFDRLELSAGVRWTHEDKNANISNPYVNPNFLFAQPLPEGTILKGPFRSTNWSPEATLSWHPSSTSMLYASYKTGYKSGGFSTPGLITTAYTLESLTYGDEKARGGEIGYKADLFGRRVRLTLTAYDYTYDHLQQTSDDPKVFVFIVKNVGKARVKGIEAEGEWRVTKALTFNGSIGYNRARYVSFPNAQCQQIQTTEDGCVFQDLSGHPLVRAPDLTANVEAVYETPISDTMKLGLDGGARYSSSYFTEETESPIAKQQGFWLLNAAVRIGRQDDRWELALIGRNLTNKIYISSALLQALGNTSGYNGSGLPNAAYVAVPERPREIVLQGSFKF